MIDADLFVVAFHIFYSLNSIKIISSLPRNNDLFYSMGARSGVGNLEYCIINRDRVNI